MKILNKFLSFLSVFVLLFSQISAPLQVLAQEASLLPEVTQSPAPTEQPFPSETPIPAPTSEPTAVEPSIESSVTPTPSPETQGSQVSEPTPTPTPAPNTDSVNPSPSDETNSTSSDTNPQGLPNAPPSDSPSPTPTVNPTPTPSVTTEPTETGHLSATVIDNSSVANLKLGLNPTNETSSATLTTDKTDYSPSETAIISGSGLHPDTTYTLVVTSEDPPAVHFEASVTTNTSGNFIYAYQLDGTYRPSYKVELKNDSEAVVATTTFTDDKSKPNLITNVKRGHIVIVKNAITNNAQDFTFQNNFGNGNPETFQLDDDSGATGENNTLSNTRDSEVIPGSYSVSEDAVAGWKQGSQTCTGRGNTPDNITVGPGKTITCAFVNKKLATIILVKNTVGGDGTFDFVMTGTTLLSSTQLTTSGGTTQQIFNNIDPDNTYTIAETPVPAGWDLTSATCTGTNTVGSITPNNGEVIICTFTNTKFGSISGYKFEDVNGNGEWDEGEPALEGWTVILSGDEDNDRETDEDGYYSFTNLSPGTYQVCEEPEGWIQTKPQEGFACDNESTGYEFNLNEEDETDVNFGNFRPGTISGQKFEDLNGNGERDQGEPGLSDWTISLFDGAATISAVTMSDDPDTQNDEAGMYGFTDLPVGTYTVTEVKQNGWTQTTQDPAAIKIQSETVVENVDFGNFEEVIITGFKWDDRNGDGVWQKEGDDAEPALADTQIKLQGISEDSPACPVDTELVQLDLTGGDGSFRLHASCPGQHRLTEVVPQGWQRTFPVDSFFDVFVEISGEEINQGFPGGKPVIAIGDPLPQPVRLEFGNHELAVISGEASQDITQTSVVVTWSTDKPSTSRVVYDTVSHPVLGAAPNYGYANSTVEDPAKVLAHSVLVSGLTVSTTYYYRTISNASPETVGDEKSVTTSSSPIPAPSGGGGGGGDGVATAPSCNDTKPGSAPTLLSTLAGANTVTLTWSKATNPVTYYLITYGLVSGLQQYGNPNVGGPDTTSYTVSELSGGTNYYFKVRAGNGCAPGDFSNELSATPGGGTVAGPAAGFTEGVLGKSDDQQQEEQKDQKEKEGVVKGEEIVSKEIPQEVGSSTKTNLPWIAVVILIIAGSAVYLFIRRR